MSASCQVCGHTPSWNDSWSGDIICARCAEWALIPRLMMVMDTRSDLLATPEVEDTIRSLANGVVRPYVTLEGD